MFVHLGMMLIKIEIPTEEAIPKICKKNWILNAFKVCKFFEERIKTKINKEQTLKYQLSYNNLLIKSLKEHRTEQYQYAGFRKP